MKYDVLKRKAGRRKCSQVDYLTGKKSVEVISEECGDSPKQVQRYLKLTKLIPELLEKVDDEIMGFTIAVELASLTEKIRRLYWMQWKVHWELLICPRQSESKNYRKTGSLVRKR